MAMHLDPAREPASDQSEAALPTEHLDAAHEHLRAIEEHLTGLIKVQAKLRRRDAELADRKWAQSLREGAEQARQRVAAVRGALPTAHPGDTVGDLVTVALMLREHVWSPATRDDIGAELEEAGERTGRPLVIEIDRMADNGHRLGDNLSQLAIDLSHAYPERITTMASGPQTSPPAGTATAVAGVTAEMLYEAIGAIGAGRATSTMDHGKGGRADVGGRVRATLDALGMPHVFAGREKETRDLLVDTLRRNFAFRDHDGVRTYYRTERLPAAAVPAPVVLGAGSQRGLGLCETETLRFHAAFVLRLVDELPAMLPYQPRLTSFDAESLRERIRIALDDLVRLMAAPLGPTIKEAEGRYRRLLLTLADWLEGGQVLKHSGLREAATDPDLGNHLDFDRLRQEVRRGRSLSPVASQEIKARVSALLDALAAIGRLIFDTGVRDTGEESAQVEQMLTLLGASAAALRDKLDALGTSPDEQEIAFFGGTNAELSIAQFTRWAAGLSADFGSSDDRTATLRPDDLRILRLELVGLDDMAEQLAAATIGEASWQLLGARRQVKEVSALIHDARELVERLLEDPDPGKAA